MARQEFVCYRECFHLNKLFKPGEKFPPNWIAAGYKPNKHFCTPAEYADMRDSASKERVKLCAGDDERTTVQLRTELGKYMQNIPQDWSRKRIWSELNSREMAEARSGLPSDPRLPPKNQKKD